MPPSSVPLEIKSHIRKIVSASNSSFFWAMYLQPERKRDAIFTLYAFRRVVDDMVDSTLPSKAKHASLKRWEKRIQGIFNKGKTDHPISVALNYYVKECNFQQADFMNFLQGMKMDIEGETHLPTLKTLENYCQLTNGSMSNLALNILGVKSARNQELSQALGTAFQFTNILRDIYQDMQEGRFYMPREILEDAGVLFDTPEDVAKHPKFGKACSLLSYKAKQHFQQAENILADIQSSEARPIIGMMNIYRSNLKCIEKHGWTHRGKAPKLSTIKKLWKTAHGYFWHSYKKTG